ncbi:NAD(P) transhydrogenase subunit alpha [Alteromonas sp. KUL42]|uniref:NAD(P) transhydrogenase subunit alpha n=1 Tax=unclassified Alteromonas TaxID=2614992 RepID=UPI00103614C4|nr:MULTISPECIES: NAD(P) transhydrogenase subunit alpha [unclassified Alteromonas]MCZ8531264.1 NAD(P) transhydrogenase subunit alpha [Alteromonas sp. PRIM-21]TAP32770.1 NAD(P) transhydrogenase subunit alpha [Alteromonas sp. KUL42]GEA07934.1 NAD(P) transhydrogenase subunit alpha [Alteromonas sp. KUL42]
MKILILNEALEQRHHAHVERRCAVSSQTIAKLVKKGIEVYIEKGAGLLSHYKDEDFAKAGANIVADITEIAKQVDILACVNTPRESIVEKLPAGTVVIGHLDPFFNEALVTKLAKANLTALSVEMIPRTSRAQKMDALSSQASLAGYAMVMKAADTLPSILPMMMTPSGTIKPAKVFIIGAGVAGLQAIATAKRLGANVLAYDTRPVVAEQVESLGGKFLNVDIGETGQTKDGYAKELSDEQKALLAQAQKEAIASSDIVITTAQLFGRKPPVLISKETLASMKPGSVVVDMAAVSGGNVEGSKPGETVVLNNVTIIGDGFWSEGVSRAATDMYANNIYNLLDEFVKNEPIEFELTFEDDILNGAVITHGGKIRNDMLLSAYEGA